MNTGSVLFGGKAVLRVSAPVAVLLYTRFPVVAVAASWELPLKLTAAVAATKRKWVVPAGAVSILEALQACDKS